MQLSRRSILTALLLPAALPVGSQEAGKQPKRDDPSTWRWNVPDGRRAEGLIHLDVRSDAMKRNIGVNIALPAGYKRDKTKRYPVVIFLHGAGGDENSDAGGFTGLLEKAAKDGVMPPAIGVFPNGGLSGYTDWENDDRVKVETFLTKELLPYVDRTYRTDPKPSKRALAGFSMGGGGAVRLALRHPDLFGAAASWAGALNSRGGSGDAAALAKALDPKLAAKPRFLLIVGDQDSTFSGHAAVVEALKAAGLKHEFRVLEGVPHNLGLYYEKASYDMTHFLGAALGK